MPVPNRHEALINDALTRAYVALGEHDVNSEPYAAILDRISRLEKLKAEHQPKRVSPDTLALIGANLAGIVLIISHEHAHVITTKAMSLLVKPR